jgi:amidase
VRDARLALSVMAKGDPCDTRWADAPLIGPAPQRPIRVALVPEVPDGFTHPAQAAAVRAAGRHLAAAGYAVEELLPPDLSEATRLWHVIGSGDVFRGLGPMMEKYGDKDAITSMHLWLEIAPPPENTSAVLDALAARDFLLYRWQQFFQHHPIVIMPTLADLPPPFDEDTNMAGQRRILDSIRVSLVAPALGLPGLAVPVGHHGSLRTGVQIVTGRFREDLALDAGEVIEAAEGVVAPIDPAW